MLGLVMVVVLNLGGAGTEKLGAGRERMAFEASEIFSPSVTSGLPFWTERSGWSRVAFGGFLCWDWDVDSLHTSVVLHPKSGGGGVDGQMDRWTDSPVALSVWVGRKDDVAADGG